MLAQRGYNGRAGDFCLTADFCGFGPGLGPVSGPVSEIVFFNAGRVNLK